MLFDSDSFHVPRNSHSADAPFSCMSGKEERRSHENHHI